MQADKSEIDLLAACMPSPAANEARREEIRRDWAVLHAKMLALGDLAVLVGDLNAEPAKAGARRRTPATHRKLADGLLQHMMVDLDLRWLGGQGPTYFQAHGTGAAGVGGEAHAPSVQWADPGVKSVGDPSDRPVRPRPRARVAMGRSGCSHLSTGRLFPCKTCHSERVHVQRVSVLAHRLQRCGELVTCEP